MIASRLAWIDSLPWLVVAIGALTLGLAPFASPHIVEKLRLLFSGKLRRPIDVFDLALHGAPWALVILKLLRAAF